MADHRDSDDDDVPPWEGEIERFLHAHGWRESQPSDSEEIRQLWAKAEALLRETFKRFNQLLANSARGYSETIRRTLEQQLREGLTVAVETLAEGLNRSLAASVEGCRKEFQAEFQKSVEPLALLVRGLVDVVADHEQRLLALNASIVQLSIRR